jgi:YgiT-type zinc finger domain-containing protein
MKANGSAACANCGFDGIRTRKITRSYGKGRNLLVIEGIPMIDCPRCGESYFTAGTMRQLDRIRRQRKTVAVPRPVEVARFTVAVP